MCEYTETSIFKVLIQPENTFRVDLNYMKRAHRLPSCKYTLSWVQKRTKCLSWDSFYCVLCDKVYSVVSEKSSCGTGRAPRPPVFDQYCRLCALTPRCRCDRVLSNSTVGLFVLHCWKVFKSQALYDEFWINLSFGRLLPSGALLEWWTDCVGLHLKSASLFISCEWLNMLFISTDSSVVSFPSDSFSNISSEHG